MKNWSKARGAKAGLALPQVARVCGNFCSVPLVRPPPANQGQKSRFSNLMNANQYSKRYKLNSCSCYIPLG
jgi:hypothetical protein